MTAPIGQTTLAHTTLSRAHVLMCLEGLWLTPRVRAYRAEVKANRQVQFVRMSEE